MSNFFEAREEAKTALHRQEKLLEEKRTSVAEHRKCLENFNEMLAAIRMGSNVHLEALLQESVLRETIVVKELEKEINSIEVNINDIRRTLKEKLSLAPAIR